MATDDVELVRHIEEEFSIYLPDDELREVYTVDNLYNLLLRKLAPAPDCLSSKAFYRIRKALIAVLGAQRRSIRPSTFLDDLFSKRRIRQQWSEIAHVSGLKLPPLHHTAMWKHWMQMLSAVLSLLITLALGRVISRIPHVTIDNFFVFFCLFLLGMALWGISYTMLIEATHFRRSVLPTFSAGELARVVLSLNSTDLALEENNAARLTSDQVWIRLVGVFCDQLAVKPEDVVPSASIVVDLGVN
jgi:hypothetical protein